MMLENAHYDMSGGVEHYGKPHHQLQHPNTSWTETQRLIASQASSYHERQAAGGPPSWNSSPGSEPSSPLPWSPSSTSIKPGTDIRMVGGLHQEANGGTYSNNMASSWKDQDIKYEYLDLDDFLQNDRPNTKTHSNNNNNSNLSNNNSQILHHLQHEQVSSGGGGAAECGPIFGPAALDCDPPAEHGSHPAGHSAGVGQKCSINDIDLKGVSLEICDDELKPRPVIRRSTKTSVPNDCKDDKYWQRRRKNNLAAKNSRDSKRRKQNQIALKAVLVEKENKFLRSELESVFSENRQLRERLSKYESITPSTNISSSYNGQL